MMQNIGEFRVLDAMPSSALGDVYRARDTRFGRTVAVTVVADRITSTPERRAQFLQDARAAAAVSHPNVATLYEVGEEDSHVYLVYEFMQGQSLRSLIGGTPLNPRRAIDLASQMADALADAHAADVVHGSITSDAVVVTPKGNAKIANFGLAWWATASGRARRAGLAEEAGGAGRAGPEGDASFRADLHSLGVILFEMLTGRVPVPGAAVPSAVNRLLPREIDPIVGRALGKSGGYQSAATLAADLRAVAATLDVRKEAAHVVAPPPVRPRRRGPQIARWIAVALALSAFAAVAWWYLRSA
jgi:serine/threonine protein kinase